jgi:hypothetical protein
LIFEKITDADADQRDVVLDPERIFLERAVDVEMVVVVIGVALVDVVIIRAERVVGQAVSNRRLRVFGWRRHQDSCFTSL